MDFNEREQAKFELKTGDVLVCEGGEPGRAAVWREEIKPCYYQKALHRLRPIAAQVNPYFVMYRLWFGGLRSEFVDSNAQTTIAHLPAIRLATLPLRVPCLDEQRRLATVLSGQFEEAGRTRQTLQAQLDEINKLPAALLRQAFSGEL